MKDSKRKVVELALAEGDWIDVMDGEGTWNVAQVLSFPSPTEVEVRYDGWGDAFDEVVLLNGDRVAPYHTYTWTVKCWAKYKNWPWWPSIVTIRPPGTEAGIKHLISEKRLFVDFVDQKDFTKRCRCWIDRSKVEPFELRFDERRKRTTGAGFEASLALVLQSTAVNEMPKFAKGTLPIAYANRIVDPVPVVRKRLQFPAWISSFNSSRERHATVYVYKTDGLRTNPRYLSDSDEGSDGHPDDVIQLDEYFDNEHEDATDRARGRKGKAKTTRKKIKTESVAKKEEVESMKSTKRPKKAATELLVSRVMEPVVKLEHFDDVATGNEDRSKEDEEPEFLSPIDDDGASLAGDEEDETLSPTKSVSDEELSGEKDTFLRPSSHEPNLNEREEAAVDSEAAEVAAMSEGSSEVTETHHGADDRVVIVDELRSVEPARDDEPMPMDVEPDDEVALDVDEPVPGVPPDVVDAIESSKDDGNDDDEASNVEAPPDPLDAWDTTRSPSAEDIDKDHIIPRDGTCGTPAPMEEERDATQDVSAAPSTSAEVESEVVREEEPRQKKLVAAKRKGGKSFIDECIAVSLGHLTDEKKNERTKKRKSSTKSKDIQIQIPEGDTVPAVSRSAQKMPVALPETVDPLQADASDAGRDVSRRSSMSAGRKGGSSGRGRTPVWVIPPPKHLPTPASDSSPCSTSSVVPSQQVFSSDLMFDSPEPFSIKKWFDRTNA